MSNLPKGKQGENRAKQFLISTGYRFVAQNFHCRLGEIDLIFLDKNILVFVEVKTRWSSEYGSPEEAVTPRKLKSLLKTIDYFITRYPKSPKALRLDVIAIDLTGSDPVIRHLQNVTG